MAVRKALQKTHSYSTKACAEVFLHQPYCYCRMTLFSGWKLYSLPPDVWNVKPLLSCSLTPFPRRSREETGPQCRAPGAGLIRKDFGEAQSTAKAFPSPYKRLYLPCPAHLPSCSHLSGEILATCLIILSILPLGARSQFMSGKYVF